MKLFQSKFFVICLVIALLLVLIPSVLAALGQTDLLRAAMGSVAKPFTWMFSKASNAVNGFVAVFTEYDDLREENQALREELEVLKNQEHENQVIQSENEWFREYLNLHSQNPNFKLTNARVIGREAGNYSTVLILDRGSIHGIKRQMPILTEDGVLGYVSEVGLDYCKVVSLVETASSIGVYTDRTNVLGTVEGELALRKEGKCVMPNIPSSADIAAGDKVYTSGGAGSVYPSGVPVGTVISIEADEQTRTLRAIVQPEVDFTELDRIQYVMIFCGYETGEASS